MDIAPMLQTIDQCLERFSRLRQIVTSLDPNLPGTAAVTTYGDLKFILKSQAEWRLWRTIMGRRVVAGRREREIRTDDGELFLYYVVLAEDATPEDRHGEGKYLWPIVQGLHVDAYLLIAPDNGCHRVQVGERVEPIYEWICDEETEA